VTVDAYSADRSLKGKVRRRYARLVERRPAGARLERPMITFGFDDAPVSAAETGAALLEARGQRGVYFISAGLAGTEGPMGPNASMEQVKRLATAGHEIACHTYSHLDCGQASADAADEDAERNRKAFQAAGLPEAATFAYPYGDVAVPTKRVLSQRYALLRGLHHGLVDEHADLNQAPAVGIEGPDGEAVAGRWMDKARRRKAWLILYTHDVCDAPSPFGCTPAALERLIDRAGDEGFDVVTLAEGCRRIGALR
jgi:peptidoglycan/xylan/chitin deacetylase (PgdA/CDA1 family)